MSPSTACALMAPASPCAIVSGSSPAAPARGDPLDNCSGTCPSGFTAAGPS
jgi:hypothetical protein